MTRRAASSWVAAMVILASSAVPASASAQDDAGGRVRLSRDDRLRVRTLRRHRSEFETYETLAIVGFGVSTTLVAGGVVIAAATDDGARAVGATSIGVKDARERVPWRRTRGTDPRQRRRRNITSTGRRKRPFMPTTINRSPEQAVHAD